MKRVSAKERAKKYAFGSAETGDPKPTRLTAKQIRAKYKTNPYISGGREGWGEALDKELPMSKIKARDAILAAVKQTGISPSLLYSSAMEEGFDQSINKPDNVSQAYSNWASKNPEASGKFIVDGFHNYGLDRFGEMYKGLIKKGYLPQDFTNKFTTFDAVNEKDETIKTAAFLNDTDALTAKAALIRDTQDQLTNYATNKKYKLTPAQSEFFTLAGYNGGVGNMQKMIDSYNEKGYLKDDKFLDPAFKPASYNSIYTNVQKRLQNKKVLDTEKYFATGGVAGLTDMIPGLADSIMSLIENNPNGYSKEPLVNNSAMANMVSPYKFAFGGSLEDLGLDENQLMELQALADEQGISIEELIEMLQEQGEMGDEGNEEEMEYEDVDMEEAGSYADMADRAYAYGSRGIRIKEKNKGKFTAAANKAGMSVQAYAKKVLGSPNTSSKLKQRANFARNASKWKHAMGGTANKSIEIEGDEVLETPSGKIVQAKGPSHEQGGIDVNVPNGTKIYSDRLSIDGKTMQERKLAREKSEARLQKILSKNPTDNLTKNSMQRTAEGNTIEEEQDMELQEIASTIYEQPTAKLAYGGKMKYAYGDPGSPYLDKRGWNFKNLLGNINPNNFNTGDFEFNSSITNVPMQSPTNFNTGDFQFNSGITQVPKNEVGDENEDSGANTGLNLTTGDYIGMAGNIFNAVAPIINTRNAARATKPNINRFQSFGRNSLEANEAAKSAIATQRNEGLIDEDSAVNAALARNRNSSGTIGTQRALNAATELGARRNKQALMSNYTNKMVGAFNADSQLNNVIDYQRMAGQERTDIADKQDTDNYFTNMADNLTNFGVNIQGVGKSLNQAHSNKVNSTLISQLSQYGLSFDEDGNLISTK